MGRSGCLPTVGVVGRCFRHLRPIVIVSHVNSGHVPTQGIAGARGHVATSSPLHWNCDD